MGTTLSRATAPTMPHMVSLSFLWSLPAAARSLRLRIQCQRRGRNIFPHRGPGADGRTAPDRHRRHELRVGPDVHFVLDYRPMLVCTVVVANDRPRADVDVLPGSRVADVSKMVGLAAGPERTCFQLHKIAHVHLVGEHGCRANARVRAD